MPQGLCVGGPMDAVFIDVRSEIGFIAVDRPGFAAWLYYRDEATGRYRLDLRPDPSCLDEDGTRALDLDRALAAAELKCLDVIAVPGSGDEQAEQPAEADLGPDPEPLSLDAQQQDGEQD